MYQKVLADTTQLYEEKIAKLIKQLEEEHDRAEHAEEQLDAMKTLLTEGQKTIQVSYLCISHRTYHFPFLTFNSFL